VALLERAAIQADRGLIGALNHLEGTVGGPEYTLAEFAERVRVHIIEFGCSGIGHLATMQGADTRQYYAPASGMFLPGNLVRVDFSSHYLGYWCTAGRMIVIGEPTEAQVQTYRDNHILKDAAVEFLRPGKQCNQVFDSVKRVAENKGIEFWEDAGLGHGVGVSEREAPYLIGADTTVLEPGMVIALDIYTFGPEQELIHSKDTYEITENGPRLISRFRNWERLYAVTGFRGTH
jgi:Xaa-Pro aminopeptidase